MLACLAQPGQGVEAVLNQCFHGVQLVHQAIRQLGRGYDDDGCWCFRLTRWGGLDRRWHLRAASFGWGCGGSRRRRRCAEFGAGFGVAAARAVAVLFGGQGLGPAAQHAFAHIVLERQCAHRQLGGIVLHLCPKVQGRKFSVLGKGRRLVAHSDGKRLGPI